MVDGSGRLAARDPRHGRAAVRACRRPSARGAGAGRALFLPDGTIFGVIASTTAPFCRTCDRGRLTADGTWLLCLYGESGLDLREAAPGRRHRRGDAALIAAHVARTHRPRRRGPRGAARPRHPLSDRGLRPIPGEKCTPGEGDAAPRRADPTADPSEHRQHRPAVRRHRHPAPPDRPLGFSLDESELRRAGLDYWESVDLWVHPDWFAFRDAMNRERCLYFSARAERSFWDAPYQPEQLPRLRQRDRWDAAANSREASRALLHGSRCRAGP